MPKIDETWIANRKLSRPKVRGTEMKLDPSTGYLTTARNVGFTSKKKVVFIERFKLCSNASAICKSLDIDQMTLGDHLMFDKKLRDDYNACLEIEGRAKKLNQGLREVTEKADAAVIAELAQKLGNYQK